MKNCLQTQKQPHNFLKSLFNSWKTKNMILIMFITRTNWDWLQNPCLQKRLQLAREAPGFKFQKKKRVTVMTCANTIGTHKIPLFLIGKSKQPRCLPKDVTKLPLVYTNQKNAWMDGDCLVWFLIYDLLLTYWPK